MQRRSKWFHISHATLRIGCCIHTYWCSCVLVLVRTAVYTYLQISFFLSGLRLDFLASQTSRFTLTLRYVRFPGLSELPLETRYLLAFFFFFVFFFFLLRLFPLFHLITDCNDENLFPNSFLQFVFCANSCKTFFLEKNSFYPHFLI